MNELSVQQTPYKGLMPYSEADSEFFFGREREEKMITANLMVSRLTLLYGASGVGKSSLLSAGVASRLLKQAKENIEMPDAPKFAVVVFKSWRDDPIAGLISRVQQSVAQLLNQQSFEPVAASGSLSENLRLWSDKIDGDLYIILDQFEEYFLYHGQENGEGTFAVEFPRAIQRSNVRANFLISMREEMLAKLDLFKGRIPNLFDNILRVEHLDRKAARVAIEKPIEKYNRSRADVEPKFRIEPELVEEVLDQVEAGRVILGESGRGVVDLKQEQSHIETPYLQLVMARLWNEEAMAGSQVLRLQTLQRLGGADRVVQTHLDKAMQSLSQSDQETAAGVFNHLVTPSGTKIAHTVSDLSQYAGLKETELADVLVKLSDASMRILRTLDPSPDRPDELRYEIFHDVLAAAILSWRTQYRRNKEQVRVERRATEQQMQVRLEEQARSSNRLRMLVVALVVVSVLAITAAVDSWRRGIESKASAAEANILRSIALQERHDAEEQKAVAVLERRKAEVSAKEAEKQRDNAERNLKEARRQEMLAKASLVEAKRLKNIADQQRLIAEQRLIERYEDLGRQSLVGGDAQSALMYLSQAYKGRKDDNLGNNSALRFQIAWALRLFNGQVASLHGHKNKVTSATFNADRRQMLTRSDDDTARLWNLERGELMTTIKPVEESLEDALLSPDGKRIITIENKSEEDALAGEGESLIIFYRAAVLRDASTGKAIEIYNLAKETGETPDYKAPAFSADGKSFTAEVLDKEDESAQVVKSFDSASGEEIGEGKKDFLQSNKTDFSRISCKEGEIQDVSKDSKRAITKSNDGAIKIYDLKECKPLALLEAPGAHIEKAWFAFDDQHVVTISDDNRAIVWKWDEAKRPTLVTFKSDANEARFTEDGSRVVTIGKDGKLKFWDAATGQFIKEVPARKPNASMQLNSTGNLAVLRDDNDLAKLWDVENNKPLVSLGKKDESEVVFSPNGKYVATQRARDFSPTETRVTVYNSKTGKVNFVDFSGNPLESFAVSNDGQSIFGAADDGRVRNMWVWSAKTDIQKYGEHHRGRVTFSVFSPDGTNVLTAGQDRVAKIWITQAPTIPIPLDGHRGAINYAVFSSDGNRVITTSADGTAKIWDASNGNLLASCDGKISQSARVFSKDGQFAIIVAADKTAKIWDAQRGQLLAVLKHDEGAVTSAAFSSDGDRVITTSDDGTVKIWNVALDPRDAFNVAELAKRIIPFVFDNGRLVPAR
jgi:WD40 repeat protein/Tfp pilus assembly protein PilE